jgi:hypothetical protein
MNRAQQVDRMATALNANRASAPPRAPQPPTAEAAAPEAEAADAALDVTDLGVAAHLAALTALAAPPPGCGRSERSAALEVALTAATASLSECDQQQRAELTHGVVDLKEEFRARLEDLEAEFVRRAQALSDELAGAVAARKSECTAALSLHAESLAGELADLRDAVEHEPSSSRGAPQPALLHYAGSEADEAVPKRGLLPPRGTTLGERRTTNAPRGRARGWDSSDED